MTTAPDVNDDGGDREECCIRPPMPDSHNTFPVSQPNFLLLHKETFSLCCFRMPGCLVVVKKKKKKTPTAQTGVSFLFPQHMHTTARCRLPVYLEMLALGMCRDLQMKCMFSGNDTTVRD